MAGGRDSIDPLESTNPESPRFASIVDSEDMTRGATRQPRVGGHTWRNYGLAFPLGYSIN